MGKDETFPHIPLKDTVSIDGSFIETPDGDVVPAYEGDVNGPKKTPRDGVPHYRADVLGVQQESETPGSVVLEASGVEMPENLKKMAARGREYSKRREVVEQTRRTRESRRYFGTLHSKDTSSRPRKRR